MDSAYMPCRNRAEKFLAAVKAADSTGAYALTADGYRSRVTAKDFRAVFDSMAAVLVSPDVDTMLRHGESGSHLPGCGIGIKDPSIDVDTLPCMTVWHEFWPAYKLPGEKLRSNCNRGLFALVNKRTFELDTMGMELKCLQGH